VHLRTFLSIPVTPKWQILSCETLVANERYNVTAAGGITMPNFMNLGQWRCRGLFFFKERETGKIVHVLNLLKPNDIYIYIYICRTAALTSRRYILNIYSTNIYTEYFKHAT